MDGGIPLQDSVVYGPIHSRRLGHSLGINILPVSHKVCSSNCVYCQYGWTVSGRFPERLKKAPELLKEIEESFSRLVHSGTRVDCVTLAGNGEPALHPELEAVIIGLKALRDVYFPKAPVGILSDSTQITRHKVRQAIGWLDVCYMKFDAAEESTWRRINDPLGHTDFQAMIRVLHELPDVILQSMFVQGTYDNTDDGHLATWIDRVAWIHPQSVQVYTIDRPTAAAGITKVPRPILEGIAARLTEATGVPAEVFD